MIDEVTYCAPCCTKALLIRLAAVASYLRDNSARFIREMYRGAQGGHGQAAAIVGIHLLLSGTLITAQGLKIYKNKLYLLIPWNDSSQLCLALLWRFHP